MLTQVVGHADIPVPSDDTKIWRYLNFTKFVAMVQDSALYFCRADMLGDHWEGVIPTCFLEWLEHHVPIPEWASGNSFAQHFREVEIPRHYLNCWHRSPGESAAMWKIYGQTEEAIAIQSNVGRLRQSLRRAEILESRKQVFQVRIGNVEYINFEEWTPPPGFTYYPYSYPFYFKRQSFAYEQEFRAKLDGAEHDIISSGPIGLKVSVDLNALIERVHVAPGATEWFEKLVIDMLKSRFENAQSMVKRSELDAVSLM